jgi:hypothetical protein
MSGDLRAVPDGDDVSLRDVVLQLEAVVAAQAAALETVGELIRNLDQRIAGLEGI